MAYRGITDPFTPKCTRNERFAQMSKQEWLIEQKKKEIKIKLEEQKKKSATEALKKLQSSPASTKPTLESKPSTNTAVQKGIRKPFWKSHDQRWKKEIQPSEDKGHHQANNSVNIFSNDGSFLDQFKKLSGVKKEVKSKKDDETSDARDDTQLTGVSTSENGQNEDLVFEVRDEVKKEPEEVQQEGIATKEQEQREKDEALQSSEDRGSWRGQGTSSPVRTSGRPSSPYSPTRATDTPSSVVVPSQAQYQPAPQLLQPLPTIALTTPPPPILTQPVQPYISYSTPPPSLLNLPPAVPVHGHSLSTPAPVPGPSLAPGSSLTAPSPVPNPSLAPPALSQTSISLLAPPTILPHSLPTNATQLLHPPPIIQQHTLPGAPILTAQTITHTVPTLSTITVSAPVMQSSLSLPMISAPVVPSLLGHHIPPPNISMPVPVPATANLAAAAGTGVSSAAPVDVSAGADATNQLALVVAQCGDDIEEIIKVRKPDDPSLWFLHDKQSTSYIQYRCLVDKYRSETKIKDGGNSYIKEEKTDEKKFRFFDTVGQNKFEETRIKKEVKLEPLEDENSRHSEGKRSGDESDEGASRRRKRRSRWAPETEKVDVAATAAVATIIPPVVEPAPAVPATSGPQLLSRLSRQDPALIQYAKQAFGSVMLSEEDWKKAEDHYKIHLLYQDMIRKRQELEQLQRSGKFKFEYDSDEETDGGTWEHRLRLEEMKATQLWAEELTKKAEGKHHIGDFLPPDELERFMEKYSALKEGREPDLSDYKEFKLKEDNIGFQMLQKLGWTEGQGLGSDGLGITEPVNKAPSRPENQGLGLERPQDVSKGDDEYDAYRKRMMLAYRFRPNPLNNPRRPYY